MSCTNMRTTLISVLFISKITSVTILGVYKIQYDQTQIKPNSFHGGDFLEPPTPAADLVYQ